MLAAVYTSARDGGSATVGRHSRDELPEREEGDRRTRADFPFGPVPEKREAHEREEPHQEQHHGGSIQVANAHGRSPGLNLAPVRSGRRQVVVRARQEGVKAAEAEGLVALLTRS